MGREEKSPTKPPREGKQARRLRVFVKELEREIKGRMVTLGIKETKGREVGGGEPAPGVPAPQAAEWATSRNWA